MRDDTHALRTTTRRRAAALAFPIAVLAACGGSPSGVPDGALGDSGLSQVRVVIEAFDNPDHRARGIPVIFSNPDGTVAAEVATDDSGIAGASLPAGGSVSTVWARQYSSLPPEPTIIDSVMGVQPGDAVYLAIYGSVQSDCLAVWPVDVTMTAFAGAASYKLFDPYDEFDVGTALVNHVTVSSCATHDLLAVAYDAGGAPIALSEETNVPLNNNALPPIAMPAFRAIGSYHIHVANADLAGAGLTIARQTRPLTSSMTPPTAPILDLDVPAVDESWGDMRLRAQVTTAAGTTLIDDPIAQGATVGSVDLATDLPAATLAATYANRRIDVTTSAPFAASFLYAHFSGTYQGGPADWHIMASPTTTSLVVPTLPADLAAFDLAATATPTVSLVESADLADWPSAYPTLAHTVLRIFRGRDGLGRVRVITAP